MGNQAGVVLTASDFQALAALRSLGRNGVPVVVIDHEHGICRYSRFKHRVYKAPPPSADGAYAAFLLDLGERENLRGWMLLPNSDACVYAISRHKDLLETIYRVPTPQWSVIEQVYIKKNTYALAQRHGIAVPKAYEAESLAQLLELPLVFPLVVKPSVRDHFYQKTKIKGYRVNDRAELETIYRRVCEVIPPDEIVVQEYIPGGAENLYSYCPFFKNGRSLAGVTARRPRQHPMDFGHASTFAEIVDQPELQPLAERFLSLIGYYGVAEVEFMLDPRDETFKLIEVNPRIWGWHSLAIAAGANLPYLMYCDMTHADSGVDRAFPDVALKWVRLITDLPTVAGEIFKHRLSVSQYAASMRGHKAFAVLDPTDPLPFIAEFCMLPYLWMKKRF